MRVSVYSKLLVGIDGSGYSLKAADHAIAIARLNGARLLVVHVVPSEDRIKGYYSDKGTSTSEDLSQNNIVNSWFENIKQKAQKAGVGMETRKISSGYTVGQVLVDLAEKEKVDLIVVGTKGTTGFKKLLLGSAALEVVSYSDCSVMIIK
jgi:nucleotide-binding universal stress UspA family protein